MNVSMNAPLKDPKKRPEKDRVKGWCPGAWQPMQAQDGLILRIRPPLGRLLPEQARGLALLARQAGQTSLALTARGNVQLRGISPERHNTLLERLAALGLLDQDAEQETARNIITTPFWREGDGTMELAQALADGLPGFPSLPGKFGFAIDSGTHPVLAGISADIRLERSADGRLLVRADGAAFGRAVAPEAAIEEMNALARWFLASGGAPSGRGRMRKHIEAGHMPPGQDAAPATAATPALAGSYEEGVLAAFAFGDIPAETLAALADYAPEIRLTPWRAMFLPNVSALPDLPEMILPGMILNPDDPLLRIYACTGAPGCAEGFAPTKTLALGLAAHLPKATSLHVSGCAKGCAHPQPADFTLTAAPEGFTLRRAGQTEQPGLDPEALLRHPGQVFGLD